MSKTKSLIVNISMYRSTLAQLQSDAHLVPSFLVSHIDYRDHKYSLEPDVVVDKLPSPSDESIDAEKIRESIADTLHSNSVFFITGNTDQFYVYVIKEKFKVALPIDVLKSDAELIALDLAQLAG